MATGDGGRWSGERRRHAHDGGTESDGWYARGVVVGGTVSGSGTLTTMGGDSGRRRRAHDGSTRTVGGNGTLTTVVRRATGGTLAGR